MEVGLIEGYRTDAVHAFRVRTLRSLGYATRVVLANGSQQRPPFASPYRVDVSVIDPGQPARAVATGIGEIAPGERRVFECADLVDDSQEDREVVFHLTPLRILARASAGLVALTREELYYYFSVQDHFVEYHRPDGFAAGVLYQSPPFNYDLFSRERTTIIQAPKGYVSREVDTLMSVAHSSADPAYATVAELRCALVAPGGGRVTWTERLAPSTVTTLSMAARARAGGCVLGEQPAFYAFYAVSETAALLPLTIQVNRSSGAIGLEHSLPPMYYSDQMRGAMRNQAIHGFAQVLGRASP